jgi:2-polyprenyl-3-methyl-5-hydroxy-6-metoxy-1,4-benzoquinol methylase
VGVRSAKGDFRRSHFADPASSKGDIQALKKSSFSFEKQHFYRTKRFNHNCGTLQVRIKMTSELVNHLQKIHEYEKTDFRWCNLRKIVKLSIVGEKILDAGCGTGHLTLELLRDNYDVTAIDYSDELVDFAQKTITDAQYPAHVFSCDLIKIKDKNLPLFDSIVCLDVIEHIENDNIALKNLYDLLKRKGTLIISVPAVKKIYGQRDKKIGHFRRYDKNELIDELENVGFVISTIRYWNFIGILPFVLFEKVLHKPINETVRYSRTSLYSKMIHPVLNLWFSVVENNIHFPIGLTLVVVCKKD